MQEINIQINIKKDKTFYIQILLKIWTLCEIFFFYLNTFWKIILCFLSFPEYNVIKMEQFTLFVPIFHESKKKKTFINLFIF